jgi:hypothetical protein
MGELDAFEDDLIERFTRHPVLARVGELSQPDFHFVLLQRRFLSLAFTPAYDLAIDLLADPLGVSLARVILREEYPDPSGATPSHREDMRDDLLRLGIPRSELVATKPTSATLQAITDTMSTIAEAGAAPHADLRLLTILRFWGEVLVSVEYGSLWRRIGPGLASQGSRFYHPHHVHDAKAHPLEAASPTDATHSDQLGGRLRELLDSTDARQSFLDVERSALAVKLRFYDQFTPLLQHTPHALST